VPLKFTEKSSDRTMYVWALCRAICCSVRIGLRAPAVWGGAVENTAHIPL